MRGWGSVRPGRAMLLVAEEQQVEIERPRRIGKRSLAAVALLDSLQAFQQRAGREPGVELPPRH